MHRIPDTGTMRPIGDEFRLDVVFMTAIKCVVHPHRQLMPCA